MGEGDKKLGRGLDFLISKGSLTTEDEVVSVPVERIKPNRQQPRRDFQPEPLADLEESIRKHGLLQPIVVRRIDDGYEIVAGERRWRAYQKLGYSGIPAIIRDVPEGKLLEYALIENIQREDLNPVELAVALKEMMSRLGLTQNEVADRIHRSRSAVANTLRLLELPAEMQEALARGRVTMGHAKALLSLREPGLRERFFKRVTDENLSVRDTEDLVSQEPGQPIPKAGIHHKPSKPAHLRDLEEKLEARLQARVRIHERKGRGRISIYFQTPENFERLFGMLTR